MTLTQEDLDKIKQILHKKLGEEFENLTTKDEFFSKMDEVMGELETAREEQTTLSRQVSSHENRLRTLEKTPSPS